MQWAPLLEFHRDVRVELASSTVVGGPPASGVPVPLRAAVGQSASVSDSRGGRSVTVRAGTIRLGASGGEVLGLRRRGLSSGGTHSFDSGDASADAPGPELIGTQTASIWRVPAS